jgi:putative serine protease PepD
VVVTEPPTPEPPVAPSSPAAPIRGLRLLVGVAVVSAALAGAVGGAVGYVAAVRRGVPTVVLGRGQPAAAPPPTASMAAMVNRVLPSVVTIEGTTGSTTGIATTIGSGFVISSSGYLLTNDHVVADVVSQQVTVTFADANTAVGRVIGEDPESDIAVVKVDRTDLHPLELADSDTVAAGDAVIAVGSPLALSGSVTAGIVSALDRTVTTRDSAGNPRYYDAIQTDAAINEGSSGGPLIDMAGRVVGVNSLIRSVAGANSHGGNVGIAFAIPINQAARIATELIDTGHARRTVMGAEFSLTTGDVGVELSRVDAGGPADQAGLRDGDIVMRLGQHPVATPDDLTALVRRFDPGTVVLITYRRGASTLTTGVTLAADAA